jgi:hypothetical protein
VDQTLRPEVLTFFGDFATSWEQAKHFFNFGTLEVERNGALTAEIVNTAGDTQFSLTLVPR